jgi:hypothetical protein
MMLPLGALGALPNALPSALPSALVAPPVHQAALDSEVAIIAIIMGSLATIAYPLVRAVARKMDAGAGRQGRLSSDAEQRLERMERAIDSIAIEVERISEAQRFTTKLLAERSSPISTPERAP